MCFASCSLTSIVIPRNVELIDGSAFEGTSIQSISIDSANTHLLLERDFLVNGSRSKAIRFVSHSKEVVVPRTITVLGKSCFNDATVDTVTFGAGSRLVKIEASCFQSCSMKWIRIPPGIRSLGASCFAGHAIHENEIGTVIFERCLGLTRIKNNCFTNSSVKSICIPHSVEMLGVRVFSGAKIETMRFEEDSRLKGIKEACFQN
jgi:hypothetical protein